MSASDLSPVPVPVRRRPEPASAPWLRLVPSVPVDAPRAPFVVFVIAVLGVGLVGLLLLNTSLQKRAFEVSSLQRTTAALADQQSALEQKAGTLSSPESLAGRAVELGMVPNTNPVFLRLSDAKVLGNPVPAKAPVIIKPKAPVVATTPVVKPATTPANAAKKKPTTATTKKPATKKPATKTTAKKTQTGSSR